MADDGNEIDSPSGLPGKATPIFHQIGREPFPQYEAKDCEKVFHSGTNAYVVVGRDNPNGHGYGGKGIKRSAAAWMTVGLGAPDNFSEVNEKNEQITSDMSLYNNAASCYISQRCDVDEVLGLADGQYGSAMAQSAAAIKADHVRIVSRQSMKLVTRTDPVGCHNQETKSVYGIDLIAGNDDGGLQPMVKGRNLLNALERIVHHLDKLSGIVDGFLHYQMHINSYTINHEHRSPFYGLKTQTVPGEAYGSADGGDSRFSAKMSQYQLEQAKFSMLAFKSNIQLFKANYTLPAGAGYILSRYHKLN